MKKKLSIIITTLLLILSLLTTHAFAEAADDFSVTWAKKNGVLQGIARYHQAGVPYEMVINGTNTALNTGVLADVAANLSAGKAMTITDPGIIDAEKFSGINPMDYNIPADFFIDMSGIRSEYEWGDSKQCWAASVSNMLTMTGWAQKAVDPDKGKPFKNEDEVFSLFTRHCFNKGCFAADGIRFFLKGTDTEDLETNNIIRKPFAGMLPDVDLSKYLQSVAVCDGDLTDNTAAYHQALALLSQIKDGGSIGLSISISGCKYTLKDDPDEELEKTNGRYRSSDFIYVKKDGTELPEDFKLEEHFYAINEEDEVVLLNKIEDHYEEAESGKRVDTALVKEDWLLKKPDGTYIYPFMIDETCYTYIDHKYYTEDQIEIERSDVAFDVYGGHAVTATGYIKNLKTDTIEGLFITNSDNDSEMMPYKAENLSKENRPNRMVVYPVHEVKGKHNTSLVLEDYSDNTATIIKVALLLPEEATKPDPRQEKEIAPPTGIQKSSDLRLPLIMMLAAVIIGAVMVVKRKID